MYLGVALTRLEDYDNAAAAYRKAISIDPEEPLFHLNHGEMGWGLCVHCCAYFGRVSAVPACVSC
jgi:tetratricopeptide (TPR) repeat protein